MYGPNFRRPCYLFGNGISQFKGFVVLRMLEPPAGIFDNQRGLRPHEFGAAFAALSVGDDLPGAGVSCICKARQERCQRLL